MNDITLHAIIGLIIVAWSLVCLLIYRLSRHAAWLAGSSVSSCLFLLGARTTISFLVEGALYLAPLWLALSILTLVHLQAARKRSTPIREYRTEAKENTYI